MFIAQNDCYQTALAVLRDGCHFLQCKVYSACRLKLNTASGRLEFERAMALGVLVSILGVVGLAIISIASSELEIVITTSPDGQ